MGFNSTSVVLLEDFVKGCFGMKLSDRCSTIFVKCVVVFLGSAAMGLMFLVEKVGGVLVVSIFIIEHRSFEHVFKFPFYFGIDNRKSSSNCCRHFFRSVHAGHALPVVKFQGSIKFSIIN